MSIITNIRKSVRSHIAGARAAHLAAPGENLTLPPAAPIAFVATDTPPSASRKAGRTSQRSAKGAGAVTNQDHAQGTLAPSDARTDAQADQTVQATKTAEINGAATVKARKTNLVLDLLNRDVGASMADLMAATQWQAHSVRAFLSSVIRKKLQYQVITEKGEDGASRYRLLRDADQGDGDAADDVDGFAPAGDAKAAAKTSAAKAAANATTIEVH